MFTYNFREIPGFSKIFLDKIEKNESLGTRFAHSSDAYSAERLNRIAAGVPNRSGLNSVILNTFADLPLSGKQKINLDTLANPSSVAVVTGQQVGFLGGPLYTIFKALSALKLADEINVSENSVPCVPIFWIEDNDHDAPEANNIYIYDKNYEIIALQLPCEGAPKAPVEELVISAEIDETLSKIENTIPESSFKSETVELLKRIYKPGKSLTDAFVEFMNEIFKDFGLLFLSASRARKQGLFLNSVQKEIKTAPGLFDAVQVASAKLTGLGYDVSAKASPVNLFFHDAGTKISIDYDSKNDTFKIAGKDKTREQLLELAKARPGDFSPKVLSRPIFQDSIIPCAAYVGGPGEISYLALTREAYELFGIEIPAVENRVSGGLLDKKTIRLLEKNGLTPDFFMRDFPEIERELKANLVDEKQRKAFDYAETELENIYSEIKVVAAQAEASLVRTAEAHLHKSLEFISVLRKKVDSANKKRNEELFTKYLQAANQIFPNRTLQERFYSPLNFINSAGMSYFIEKLKLIYELSPTEFRESEY